MHRKWCLYLTACALGALPLAACLPMAQPAGAWRFVLPGGQTDLRLVADIKLGRSLLAFQPYTGADVARVQVVLTDETASSTALSTEVLGLPSAPLVVEGLRPNRQYRLRLDAYNTAGTLISNPQLSEEGISTTPNMAGDFQQEIAESFDLVLANRPFPGLQDVQVSYAGPAIDGLRLRLLEQPGATGAFNPLHEADLPASGGQVRFEGLKNGDAYRLVAEAIASGDVTASVSSSYTASTANADDTGLLPLRTLALSL